MGVKLQFNQWWQTALSFLGCTILLVKGEIPIHHFLQQKVLHILLAGIHCIISLDRSLTRAASSAWIIQYQKPVNSNKQSLLWLINKKQLCSFTEYLIKKIWFIYVSDFSVIPWLIYENCIICWNQRKTNACVICHEIMNSTIRKKQSSSIITMQIEIHDFIFISVILWPFRNKILTR